MTRTLLHIGPHGFQRNATPFGSRLRSASRRCLPWFLERHDFGFQDGGCAIIARALVLWSGARLRPARYALDRDRTRVQHVVARDGGVVLDGDGLMTPEEGVAKLGLHEGMPGCVLLEGFDHDTSPSIPRDDEASSILAGMLGRMLPDPSGRPWIVPKPMDDALTSV